MCKLKLILIIVMFFSATGWSAQEKKSKYSYTVAQTESYDWVYQLPNCAQLSEKKYNAFNKAEKCQKLEKNSESCETDEIVTLTNTVSSKKKAFKLNYIVFNSLAECQSDRENYLQASE